jgi:hypothetical protein
MVGKRQMVMLTNKSQPQETNVVLHETLRLRRQRPPQRIHAQGYQTFFDIPSLSCRLAVRAFFCSPRHMQFRLERVCSPMQVDSYVTFRAVQPQNALWSPDSRYRTHHHPLAGQALLTTTVVAVRTRTMVALLFSGGDASTHSAANLF